MASQERSADAMVRLLEMDDALMAQVRTDRDPGPALKKAATMAKEVAAFVGDRLVYRIAVGVLGAIACIAAIGSIVLVALGKTTPEALVALGSASVGALVGLFAPSPAAK